MTLREPGTDPGISRAGTRWWLISGEPGPDGVLTLDLEGLGRTLPVFSFREEAELFLRLGGHEGYGLRARESGAGEAASLLRGPLANVRSVALDPLPGVLGYGTAAPAGVGRERFLGGALGGR